MEAFFGEQKMKTRRENGIANYQEFYFLNDYSDFVLENKAGLLMLHK